VGSRVGDDGKQTVYEASPETTPWLGIKLRLLGPFIPEREL
jgi:hypothetical protein